MTAFDHFQAATVHMSQDRPPAARRSLIKAIAWIDRTGRERELREDLAELLQILAEDDATARMQ